MDRTAKLWQMERAYPLRIYSGHESDVDVVKFHPNCNYLATGSSDKTLRLWSHADAKMVRIKVMIYIFEGFIVMSSPTFFRFEC